MNQEMLDQLIGPVPPSTVDVDTVIRRRRRRIRIRRLAAAGSTALAVVLIAVLGAGLTRAPQPSRVAPPAAAPPSALASPSPTGQVLRTTTPDGRKQALAWFQTALSEALAAQAPHAKLIFMPTDADRPDGPDGHPDMTLLKDPVGFRATTGLLSDGLKGGLYASLRPITCAPGQSCELFYNCDWGVYVCDDGGTPFGSKYVRYVDEPGQGWRFYGVDVMLRDGDWALSLRAVNYFGGDGSAPTADTPVLTRRQLDAVAFEIAGKIAQVEA